MSIAFGAATGHYEATGNPAEATHVIAQAFGYRKGPNGEHLPGPINEELALHLGALGSANPQILELPWVLQQEVADSLPDYVLNERGRGVDLIVGHHSEPSRYLDSWNVFQQAKGFTDALEKELGVRMDRPPILAQAHHIGRVAAQARKIGYDPIVPKGLAEDFDPKSAQLWTRSDGLWVLREIPALAVLKKKHRL